MTEPTVSADSRKAYLLLMWGFLAILLWVPSLRLVGASALVGCALLFSGLRLLAPGEPRYVNAMIWVGVLGVCVLIELIVLVWPGGDDVRRAAPEIGRHIVRRGNVVVAVPYLFPLRDILLVVVVWQISAGLIARANARTNIPLRDLAANRRDLYLIYFVLWAMLFSVLAWIMSDGAISAGTYQLIKALVIVYRLTVMVLWMLLLRRAAEGFEAEKEVI